MGTNQNPWFNGTMPWNWGPGFVTYAGEYPRYYSFSTTWIQSPLGNDFNNFIIPQINVNHPVGVMFWGSPLKPPPTPPKYTWHYVAVRGYWVDDTGQYMVVNDGWGSTDMVNWDINWGTLSLHFVYPN
jgi:hypothetical protein